MLIALFEFLLFLLALPALFVFLLFRFVADVADYFGFWLFPGVFGLSMGLNLSMVAPSDPDVPFESGCRSSPVPTSPVSRRQACCSW
ncbi:hypothetical protein LJH30_004484 [Salmonella enterica]|nr:hypothetical protein [Salmonella enterica]